MVESARASATIPRGSAGEKIAEEIKAARTSLGVTARRSVGVGAGGEDDANFDPAAGVCLRVCLCVCTWASLYCICVCVCVLCTRVRFCVHYVAYEFLVVYCERPWPRTFFPARTQTRTRNTHTDTHTHTHGDTE